MNRNMIVPGSNLSSRKFIITSAIGLAGVKLFNTNDQDTVKKGITQDVKKGKNREFPAKSTVMN